MDIIALKKYIHENFKYSFEVLKDSPNGIECCLFADGGDEKHDIWTIKSLGAHSLTGDLVQMTNGTETITLRFNPFAIFAIMFV